MLTAHIDAIMERFVHIGKRDPRINNAIHELLCRSETSVGFLMDRRSRASTYMLTLMMDLAFASLAAIPTIKILVIALSWRTARAMLGRLASLKGDPVAIDTVLLPTYGRDCEFANVFDTNDLYPRILEADVCILEQGPLMMSFMGHRIVRALTRSCVLGFDSLSSGSDEYPFFKEVVDCTTSDHHV